MQDYITTYWFLGFLVFTPVLRTVPWLNVWVFYAYAFSLISAQFPVYLDELTIPLRVSMENFTNNFLVWLLVFVLFMKYEFSNLKVERVLRAILTLLLVSGVAAFVFEQFIYDKHRIPYFYGIIPNKGMNAILLVTLLPFFLNRYLFMLVTLFVIDSKSSSALLSYLTFCSLYLVMNKKINYKYVLGAIGFVVAYALFDDGLFNGTTRFPAYKFFFSFMNPWNYLFGFSSGSFFPMSVFLQDRYRFQLETGLHLWAHSDPFQYFFEFGLIGVPPLLYTMGGVLKYAERRSLLAFGAFLAGSLFYYPFHFPIHLIVLVLLVKMSVNNYSSLKAL